MKYVLGKPIRGLPHSLDLTTSTPPSEVYKRLASESRYPIHQLRVTKGSDGNLIPNENEGSIYNLGLRNESTIYVKDLGPQIAWRTVFIIEYLGPILIHPLVYLLRPQLYRNAPEYATQSQTICFILVMAHFIKRELETIFVHRFSAATMPALNIFKNSGHYWLLSGLNMAYWIYSPGSPAARQPYPLALASGVILYLVGELGNLYIHLQLSQLRSAGGRERGIPQGLFFQLVTCPNYMFESLAWIGVFLASQFSWSVLLFIVVSVGQMMPWAKKKERRYRQEFGDKYKKKRFVMLPGIY